MKLPKLLPIKRMEGYATHYMGKSAHNELFWIHEANSFELPKNNFDVMKIDEYRKEFLFFHRFDAQGKHLATEYLLFRSSEPKSKEVVDKKRAEWLSTLGNYQFSSISVQLFKLKIEGVTVGLVPNEESETIDLEPDSQLFFQEPWNGEFVV